MVRSIVTDKPDFDKIVEKYRQYPYIEVDLNPEMTTMTVSPISASHCYLHIQVDSSGRTEILVDETGTFDNLDYQHDIVEAVITDVLQGNISKVTKRLFGMECCTKLHLQGSGLKHTSTLGLLYPVCLFLKWDSVTFEAYPEA